MAVAVALGAAAAAAGVDADPSWRRGAEQPVPPRQCQELHVAQAGAGFLEVRLVPYPLPPLGSDAKISGASVFVPANGDRATVALYHTTGPYTLTVGLDGPLRWSSDGTDLCFAGGDRALLCGRSDTEVRYAQTIPFGSGWKTEIVPCAAFTAAPPRLHVWPLLPLAGVFAALLALQARHRSGIGDVAGLAALLAMAACAGSAWLDPWRIDPSWLLATALVTLLWLLIRLLRRRGRGQGIFVALWATAALAMVLAPHPLHMLDGARRRDEAAAPPLWADAAYWHFHSPQQELAFRDQPIGELPASAAPGGDELWLVAGGSVTFGWETDPQTTFTALAEQQLRRDGYRVRLLNAGVGGWNIGQLDRVLRDIGDRLPLRGIVFVSILNNAAFPIVGPPGRPPCSTLLCAYAYNLSRNYLLAPVINYFRPVPGNRDRFAAMLDAIVTREVARGRIVVLVDETHSAQVHPAWFNRWIGAPHDRYRAAARAIGAKHGLELHRVDDVVAALPAAEQFTDGMHLTPAAHTAVAARLADILRAQLGPPGRP